MAELVVQGDCLKLLADAETWPDNMFDALVTDPPSGTAFMNLDWDCFRRRHNPNDVGRDNVFGRTSEHAPHSYGESERENFIAWLTEIMKHVYRVLKPGAHGLVWALPRTSHWTGIALEDAGFEVRDCVHHFFGCLSEDSELLTSEGWMPYHKISVGQHALCYNNDEGTYAWQPVQETFVYDYADTAYRLRGARTDQVVSRLHRCLVERDGDLAFQTAEALACQCEARVPVLESLPDLLQALAGVDEGTGTTESALPCVSMDRLVSREAGAIDGTAITVGQLHLPNVQDSDRATSQVGAASGARLLQPFMPSEGSLGSPARGCQTRPSGVERRAMAAVAATLDRCGQSCLEGRRHLDSQEGELPGDQVCAMPRNLPSDGAEGWIRDGAPAPGGSSDGAPTLAERGCPSLESRSDRQSAGEPSPVCQQQRSQAVRASRFTTTDLVRIKPIHYVGKVWCVRVPTGAFVARRNGQVFVTGNSGFPKNLNVSKAIDKAAGAEREVIGPDRGRLIGGTEGNSTNHGRGGIKYGLDAETAPATDEAAQWDGWGTALKPALECWWLIRKPISEKSITANVLKWGTGAINIDGCRVRRAADDVPGWHKTGSYGRTDGFLGTDTFKIRDMPPEEVQARCGKKGRWPAHVVLSHDPRCVLVGEERVKGCPATVVQGGEKNPFYNQDDKEFQKRHTEVEGYGDADGLETVDLWACVPGCPVRLLDDQGGRSRSREGKPRRSAKPGDGYGMVHTGAEYNDAGGVSRYFYTPKPSKAEREHGLDDMPEGTLHRMRPDKDGATGLNTEARWGPVQRKNTHATVKSVALMQYLCRLITPPSGIILDPFCGSGTTGMAARREGFEFVGIEKDENHCEVARRRIEAALTLK